MPISRRDPTKRYQPRLGLRPGQAYAERGRSARVEGTGRMWALVYYAKQEASVVEDRPIFWTANDVLARVDCIHRCGTDVKTYYSGRADQIDDSILATLGDICGLAGEYDPSRLKEYVELLRTGRPSLGAPDPMYAELAARLSKLSDSEREALYRQYRTEGGRVLGHEMCITVVKVGTNVRNLRRPLGYTENLPALSQQYLDFKPGERLTIQTRVARYEVPPPHLRGPDISGIQLLADNHENMAMTLDGGFAQYLRLTPEMIQSGSLIRVPEGMCEIEAALIEPTACLLDCLNLSTHPEAQGPRGNIFKPGLKRGGRTAIIGSGTMAFIGAALALSYDELVPVGGARKVVMFVISQEHTDLGWKFFPEAPIEFMVNPLGTSNEDVLRKVYERYGPDMAFDDVLVAAGGPEQVALAHRMCASTGARVHVFAGTRGTVALESGFWHYGNAATSGTSGCNTRAMENVMGMIRRGLKLARFSGKAYTLKELSPDPSPFFADLFLRPLLRPNEGLPEVRFEEA